MTTVYVDPILASAFNSLDQLAGGGSWSGSGRPEQEAFLDKLGALTETIASLPPGAIETIAARSAGPVNAFLARHGFAGNLREAGPQSLYAAAVLDLLVEWGTPGSAVPLALPDGRRVPGVRLKKGHFRVDGRVLSPEVRPGPIYVRMCESASLDEGLDVIAGLDLSAPDWDYGAATFPMVSLDVDVDASKVIGLRNGDWTVDQAFARAKLRLDPKGAHAQAAAAMAATRGIVKTFKIAGPFTIAFVTGDGKVAIAYHVTEEHFSAPV
jgi:hypothetical protein